MLKTIQYNYQREFLWFIYFVIIINHTYKCML